jgi:hypothetical protein
VWTARTEATGPGFAKTGLVTRPLFSRKKNFPFRSLREKGQEHYFNHVQDLVKDTLDMIIQLFPETKKLKGRYGCKEILSQTASSPLPILTGDFGAFENLVASSSPPQGLY